MSNHTKFARVIKAAETKVNADAESVRTELEAVRAALPLLKEKAQDLKDDLGAEAEVKTRIKKGEDVPALDLLIARAEDEIAEYRLKAFTGKANALSNRLPSPHTLLAEHIVPALAGVLPGVEVIATTAPIGLWKGDIPEGTLSVVLYQSPRIETDPYTGVMSGDVTAYFIRSALMRPISIDGLETYAMSKRISLEVRSNNVGDENGWVTVAGNDKGNQSDPTSLVMDSLTIRVAGVMDGLPVIRTPETNSPVKDMTLRVFSGLQRPGIVTTARVSVEPDPQKGTEFVIRYGASTAMAAPPSVSETINDNERTLVLRQVVTVSNVEPASFVAAMTKTADGALNGPTLGMGVLTDVAITPRESALSGNNAIEVVLTYKSLTV